MDRVGPSVLRSSICARDNPWFAARNQGLPRPLTPAEEEKRMEGVSREKIAEERMWRNRPDGIAIKMPAATKSGSFCILGFTVARTSDATDQYVVRAKRDVKYAQTYTSSKSGKQAVTGIETIGSKLVMKIFDRYANILRGMYSMSEVQREPFRQRCLGAGPIGPTRTHTSLHQFP